MMTQLPKILCACTVTFHIVTIVTLDTTSFVGIYLVALITARDDVIAIDVGLYSCNNLRMTGWIFMNFGAEVMPLVADPNS
jgi:hypothetical protein